MLARVIRFPLNKPPHISRSLPHSALNPFIFMSPFTHSHQDFFSLPRNLDPTTVIDLQADTQSDAFLRSMCPNHLSLLFFFSSRRRHTRSLRDWSSDVCSSD